MQRRTLLEMFTNDTGMWTRERGRAKAVVPAAPPQSPPSYTLPPSAEWLDFKTSSVIAAREHALFTGDVELLQQLWSDNDLSILVSVACDEGFSLCPVFAQALSAPPHLFRLMAARPTT